MSGNAHPARFGNEQTRIASFRPCKSVLCFCLGLLGILGPLGPETVLAGTYFTSNTLDDINQHQAQGFLGLYLGDQLFLPSGHTAISGHVAVGLYGYEAISGMFGLTLQNASLYPVGLGFGYTYLDAEFETRTWTLNSQYTLAGGNDPWLMAQAAVGRQVQTQRSRDQAKSFREFGESYPPQPDNPRILVDDSAWTYCYLHLVAEARVWLFRPQLDLGYLVSWYSYSGHECVNGDCADPGDPIERKGSNGNLIWGLGLGLDLTGLRLFAGIRPHSELGVFLARVTLMFF